MSQAPEITPRELVDRVEAGLPLQVLDVRAPLQIAAGTVEVVPSERYHNVPGSEVLQQGDTARLGLDPALPTAVVCARGQSSVPVAAHLQRLGLDVCSVRGGMQAWMRLAVPREIDPPPKADRLVQLDRIGKGALGYLLVSAGEAVAVDIPRDPELLLTEVAASGARLVAIADTHCHADYLSGGPALAAELGIPYRIHPADAVYPYDGSAGRLAFAPLADGEAIAVGRCALEVRHTPGHTEGSVTLLAGGVIALTGDFLFIGSVGRPDLAGKTAAWTRELWRSLERARRDWPDELLVLPAHYAGEGERRADRAVAASLGELKRSNPALAITDSAAFADWVAARSSGFPDAYPRIKAANLGLLTVSEAEADELEMGRNECALGSS